MTDTIRHMREKRFWRGAAVVGAFLAASGLCAQPVVPKQLATSQHFMVVAAHPLAARAGYDAIRQGGSAVDEAIAVELVLGLVEPQSSGVGGGGFRLHCAARDAKLEAYDGRETAPAAAKPERFLGADGRPLDWADAVVSGKSVGVPGLLRLFGLAHRGHGKLPWVKLFEPAIRLAREGFPISPRLNSLVAADRFLPLDANARRYFYLPGGKAKPAGTLLKNPEYAAVLKRVAAGGAGAFYRGEIARDIAAAVRKHKGTPGDLVESDFSAYSAIRREPLCGAYRRWKVCGMPPPSSGGFAVLQLLEILERFDLSALKPDSVGAVHLFAEAGRLAYADRQLYFAHPGFVRWPPAGLVRFAFLAFPTELIG